MEMTSATPKIRHVFGFTFFPRALPPVIEYSSVVCTLTSQFSTNEKLESTQSLKNTSKTYQYSLFIQRDFQVVNVVRYIYLIRFASLWNSILSDLKTCTRLNSFRTSLRKYYESKLPIGYILEKFKFLCFLPAKHWWVISQSNGGVIPRYTCVYNIQSLCINFLKSSMNF